MIRDHLWRVRPAQILLVAALAITLVIVVGRTSAQNGRVPMATDWSHRHLIFSQPHSLFDAFKLSSNPRYVQQWVRRNAEKKGHGHGGNGGGGGGTEPRPIQGDWSVYLGNLGTVGAGNYPAKYSFDITASSCTAPQPDFIVYNTSLAGSTTAVAAIDTGTFSARPTTSSIITIVNGANTLVMAAEATNANLEPGIGTYNRLGGGNGAANLAAAINIAGNGSFVGVSATSAGAVVTITATTAGAAGNNITVTSEAASNFTWTFGNLVDGASGVATVTAYDNLYSSCSGTVPSPYWAFITGAGATAATSVVLSKDGSQVAFVQNTGGGAQLVLLKWAAGTSTVNTPQDLTGGGTNVSNANYRACAAPCMTTINLSGGATDTNSSPFYDYTPGADTLYVGDNATALHKFTGVFLGTPAETISAGANVWPAVLNGVAHTLTSPVYDSNVGQIFVADDVRVLYRVDSTIGSGAGGIVATASLGSSGITDSPAVDPSIGNVYVFVRGDSAGGAAKRAAVCQFSTSFATGATCTGAAEATLSTNATLPTAPFFDGDFDNAYYTSANGTGNLYVCGNSVEAGVTATALWQIPITAGVLGTPVQGPQLTTGNFGCSPITEFMNGATDRIFVSVVNHSLTTTQIGCPLTTTGCIMSFDITNPAIWATTTATSAATGVAGTGGTSGIIIDSSAGTAGGSQIYFTPLAAGTCTTASGQGMGGCAIQASQAGLN